ncbi:hypothetical protein [Aquirufa sp. OSTEICH-129A]
MKKLLIILLFLSFNSYSQTKFVSNKYNYSFVIPDGWYIKEKIYTPEVDAKIVDDQGNSFIVSIKTFHTATKLTAKQQMEDFSNYEFEEQLNAIYGTTKILKRGSFPLDSKEFYFIHLLTPFQNGLQLYHKQFIYSYGNKVLTIDACSIETYLDETSPAYAIMLNTFKLLNLKNK